jgi:hypothetical protein
MEISVKAIAAFVLAAASLASPALHAQEVGNPSANPGPDVSARVEAATDAAAKWLAAMDAGQTAEAWDAAAPMMQTAVTRETWSSVGSQVRAPLGAVKTRTLGSAGYTRTLPNAPAGEYVVIQYNTDFARRTGVVETVVPMRQPDGSWKVSGYFVR